MADADAVVVGAGAVGLAAARALARRGLGVIVLEAQGAFGTGTSSRSSEVVHAGLYYPAGSLKAELCVAGRRLLVAYLAERGVPLMACGKLVVAGDEEELAAVEGVKARGEANGVEGLAMLSGAAARALEPALACVGALHSPVTGAFDSHGYMLALLGEVEDAGGALALNAPFEGAAAHPEGWEVRAGGASPARITARHLVLSAGLDAAGAAALVEGLAPEHVPVTRLAKGSYFVLSGGRAPFSRLIYPAPARHGLGIHLTLDLQGQARFGPDVEWVEAPDHSVDPARGPAFEAAVRRYWPGLPAGALVPGYAGLRPKIAGPDEPAADFRIDGPARHGLPGLVALHGIESPGLTASLAIGERVADLLEVPREL